MNGRPDGSNLIHTRLPSQCIFRSVCSVLVVINVNHLTFYVISHGRQSLQWIAITRVRPVAHASRMCRRQIDWW